MAQIHFLILISAHGLLLAALLDLLGKEFLVFYELSLACGSAPEEDTCRQGASLYALFICFNFILFLCCNTCFWLEFVFVLIDCPILPMCLSWAT